MRAAAALLVVAAAGFISLSYEILWFRAFSFASGTSPAAFGVLLGFFLLGLALGALWTRRHCRDGDARGRPENLRALAVFVLAANILGYLVVPALALVCSALPGGIWGLALPLVAAASGMFGAVLPLVSHHAIAPDDRAGVRLSRLYLSNIVGSALGSWLTGFVLMDRFSLAGLHVALAVMGLLTAAFIAWPSGAGRARLLAASITGAVLCILLQPFLYAHLWERLQLKDAYEGEQVFRHVVENRHGVITVTQDGTVYGGGVFDGCYSTSLVNDRNWIIRCYALAALDRAPKQVLVVGLSSGSWAQALAHMPGVEKVTIIEINPGYVDLIPLHEEVASLLRLPKSRVEIIIDDGRRWLQRHPGARFDLMVQNTTWHWRAHSTNLLSREYLEMCRARLSPGGVLYYNTTFSDDAMVTAATVFPHALRVYNFMAGSDRPLLMDAERLRRRLAAWTIDGRPVLDLTRAPDRAAQANMLGLLDSLDGPYRNEQLESRGHLLRRLAHASVITDDNMLCEWRALHW